MKRTLTFASGFRRERLANTGRSKKVYDEASSLAFNKIVKSTELCVMRLDKRFYSLS
jgi:hypothetical protein